MGRTLTLTLTLTAVVPTVIVIFIDDRPRCAELKTPHAVRDVEAGV
jgi:hypothetical protein